jgi:hypothetical protein
MSRIKNRRLILFLLFEWVFRQCGRPVKNQTVRAAGVSPDTSALETR